MTRKSAQIAVRVEPATLDLIDEVMELVATASVTGRTSKAAVMRAALRRGLEEMRREVQSQSKPKKAKR